MKPGEELSFELNIKVEYGDGESVDSGANLDDIKDFEDAMDNDHKTAGSIVPEMETLSTNSGVQMSKVKSRRLKRKKEVTRKGAIQPDVLRLGSHIASNQMSKEEFKLQIL